MTCPEVRCCMALAPLQKKYMTQGSPNNNIPGRPDNPSGLILKHNILTHINAGTRLKRMILAGLQETPP